MTKKLPEDKIHESENTMYMTNSSVEVPKRKFDLEERTSIFARRVRLLIKKIPKSASNKEDGEQLIRSSGSVAANYIEANESLGKRDFMMRTRISLKESKESRLWLSLLQIPDEAIELENERQYLWSEADQFVRIFCTILRRVETNWKLKR